MKKKIFVPVLVFLPVILMSLVSSLFPSDISADEFSLNIREITYNIDTNDAKGGFRYKVVGISKDGILDNYLVTASSPLDALLDLNFEISNTNRIISTSPIDYLYNGSYIRVKSFYSVIEEVKSDIEFQTQIQGNTLCKSLSSEKVEQEGVLGLMTSTVKKTYDDGILIAEEILNEHIDQEPRTEILILEGPNDSPIVDGQPNTYDCDYWYGEVDKMKNANAEEKRWLKEVMYCESGCNAASDKNSKYKGLFQWDPCFWYKQYPNDNIYDGHAQLEHTLFKIKAGARTMWPVCNRRYDNKYN